MHHDTAPSAAAPFKISIVIPTFNREALIGRAIDSCLCQHYPDFEVVVVDDASTDRSAQIVAAYSDARVRLIRHETNRGVCPARNTGADHATGDWIVMLDSDDELLPGALEIMAAQGHAAADDIGCIYLRCLKDDGSLSPEIEHISGRLDYAGYLAYLEACTGGSRDLLYFVRRKTFATVRFPDNHGLEDCYHLDFNRAFRSFVSLDVVRLYHQDAANSLVKRTATFHARQDRSFVRERGDNIEQALARHSAALRVHAPSLFGEFESRLLTLRLLASDRLAAVGALARLAHDWRRLPKHLAIFAVGLPGPASLAGLRALRAKLRSARAIAAVTPPAYAAPQAK